MTDAELAAFLDEQRIVLATHGRDGWPHLMPLWYVVRDGELWAWTYARSQKVENLERDPRCTLQVEAGARVRRAARRDGQGDRDPAPRHRDVVAASGQSCCARYGGVIPTQSSRRRCAPQAAKRVALQFAERSRVTWDHRKLGGVY